MSNLDVTIDSLTKLNAGFVNHLPLKTASLLISKNNHKSPDDPKHTKDGRNFNSGPMFFSYNISFTEKN